MGENLACVPLLQRVNRETNSDVLKRQTFTHLKQFFFHIKLPPYAIRAIELYCCTAEIFFKITIVLTELSFRDMDWKVIPSPLSTVKAYNSKMV